MEYKFKIDEKTISEKVESVMALGAFDKVMEEVIWSIVDTKEFKAALKEKLTKEINKQLDGKIKEFVKDIRLTDV